MKKMYSQPSLPLREDIRDDLIKYHPHMDINKGWVILTIDDMVGFLPHVFHEDKTAMYFWLLEHYSNYVYGIYYNGKDVGTLTFGVEIYEGTEYVPVAATAEETDLTPSASSTSYLVKD